MYRKALNSTLTTNTIKSISQMRKLRLSEAKENYQSSPRVRHRTRTVRLKTYKNYKSK